MAKKRTKPTIEQFNTRVRKAQARLISEATRLGVTTAQLAIIAGLFGNLATAGTWCFLWELYTGGETTCTPNVRKAIKTLRGKLEKALSAIYNDIPASIWNDDDRSIFGLKKGTRTPPTKPPKIEEKIVPVIKNIGGGKIKIGCRTTTDEKRSSLAFGATGVKIAYSVVDHPTKNDVQDETKIKRQVVDSADGCDNLDYFSGATFELELDPADVGRELQYFLRWYNVKHKENAGPWCGPFSANI